MDIILAIDRFFFFAFFPLFFLCTAVKSLMTANGFLKQYSNLHAELSSCCHDYNDPRKQIISLARNAGEAGIFLHPSGTFLACHPCGVERTENFAC